MGSPRNSSVEPSIRWGLCCLFREAPIHFRTTTATYAAKLGEGRASYLAQLILDNLVALEQAILFCQGHQIGSFRINSHFLPLATHPQLGYELQDLPRVEEIEVGMAQCRQLAQKMDIRLIFHPDQFVVLNSPRAEVVQSSLAELESQGMLAEKLGADVINIHAGGRYGDKQAALERLAETVPYLSERTRARLTLENDDKSFSPEDLLPLCQKLGIPLVYDVHHHRCLPDELSEEEASRAAYATWPREPLFHISSPIQGWNGPHPERHHDYIDVDDFPLHWHTMLPLTVEVEAKAKELAIARLQRDLQR